MVRNRNSLASFLSALNDRSDGYGGARENRVRLPLEVYQAVRGRVGRDSAVGCRMSGDDVVEGGSRIGDATYFAVELARAGAARGWLGGLSVHRPQWL